MTTYLSIDIDFWLTIEDLERSLIDICEQAKRREIKIRAVMNHQQLLPFVNAANADVLINIDEHSDLTDKDTKILDCGAWVSYVKNRKTSTYIWYRNDKGFWKGNCNGFWDSNNGRCSWDHGTDWFKVKSKYRSQKADFTSLLEDCKEIGIVMSPAYTIVESIPLFKKVVKEYKIPYLKGLMREYKRRRNISPNGLTFATDQS